MNLYGNGLFFAVMLASLFFLQMLLVFATKNNGRTASAYPVWLDLLFALCISVAVSSLFRLYPGNARPPIQDSSAFLYIGKRMTEGKLPYRDLFDHKGPLLYLIQWLGISLTPGRFTGVWILEVLNLFATSLIMIKLAMLTGGKKSEIYLAVMAVLGVCGWMVWQGGNFTEEFALPWISCAALICFSFFRSGTYRNRDVFLLGAGFSAVLLLRANMIAAWGSLMPIVLVRLLRERRFSAVGRCAICFVGGIVLFLGPILFWASKAGFLREFCDDYLLFNLRYTDSVSVGLKERVALTARFMLVLWPASAAVLLSLVPGRNRRLMLYNLIFYVLSAFTAAMSGRLYYHYAIVILPAAVLPFCTCFNFMAELYQKRRTKCRPSSAVLAAMSVLVLLGALSYRHLFSDELEDDPVTVYLKENTRSEDDVLIVGNSSWYYLLAERKTDNRFFYQLPPLEISESLRAAFFEELKRCPPDCVVFPGYREDRNWMDYQLGGLKEFLESSEINDYQQEEYDSFEVYIRQRNG